MTGTKVRSVQSPKRKLSFRIPLAWKYYSKAKKRQVFSHFELFPDINNFPHTTFKIRFLPIESLPSSHHDWIWNFDTFSQILAIFLFLSAFRVIFERFLAIFSLSESVFFLFFETNRHFGESAARTTKPVVLPKLNFAEYLFFFLFIFFNFQ